MNHDGDDKTRLPMMLVRRKLLNLPMGLKLHQDHPNRVVRVDCRQALVTCACISRAVCGG